MSSGAERNWYAQQLPDAEEGFVATTSASADANGVDLNTIGNTTTGAAGKGPNETNQPNQKVGLATGDRHVLIQADGADVWITSGKDQASVTGANAPSSSATGKGILGTPATGICFRIKNGDWMKYTPKPDRPWLNWIGSGVGKIRIFKVSQ